MTRLFARRRLADLRRRGEAATPGEMIECKPGELDEARLWVGWGNYPSNAAPAIDDDALDQAVRRVWPGMLACLSVFDQAYTVRIYRKEICAWYHSIVAEKEAA